MKQRYTVSKTFLEGALKGMTIKEETSVEFEIGKTYGGGWSGSRYKVTGCEPTPTELINVDHSPQQKLNII